MNTVLRKQYIGLVVSIVVSIAAGVLFALVLSKMKVRFDSTNALKEKLVSYQINKKAFNEEAVQIRSLQRRLEFLESKVFKNSSVPELLSRLEGLADFSRVNFEITNVQTIMNGDTPRLVVVGSADGSYEQVAAFFDLLQRQTFQVQFQGLTIFSETIESGTPEVADPLSPTKTKTPTVIKETRWHGVATLEIISFK